MLKDYVSGILNTVRADSEWFLNLSDEMKQGNRRVERGTGNVVSVEFSVVYHWHAALSETDSGWLEELFKKEVPGLKSMDDIGPKQFGEVLWTLGDRLKKKPAKEWEFHNLKRGADGRFSDFDIAELLKDCIEEPAHTFGSRSCPASLKLVEIMGMVQARQIFNVCTLNE